MAKLPTELRQRILSLMVDANASSLAAYIKALECLAQTPQLHRLAFREAARYATPTIHAPRDLRFTQNASWFMYHLHDADDADSDFHQLCANGNPLFRSVETLNVTLTLGLDLFVDHLQSSDSTAPQSTNPETLPFDFTAAYGFLGLVRNSFPNLKKLNLTLDVWPINDWGLVRKPWRTNLSPYDVPGIFGWVRELKLPVESILIRAIWELEVRVEVDDGIRWMNGA